MVSLRLHCCRLVQSRFVTSEPDSITTLVCLSNSGSNPINPLQLPWGTRIRRQQTRRSCQDGGRARARASTSRQSARQTANEHMRTMPTTERHTVKRSSNEFSIFAITLESNIRSSIILRPPTCCISSYLFNTPPWLAHSASCSETRWGGDVSRRLARHGGRLHGTCISTTKEHFLASGIEKKGLQRGQVGLRIFTALRSTILIFGQ